MIAPIIIEISHKDAMLYYDIDFENFTHELSLLPGVKLIDHLCFEGTMRLGFEISCKQSCYPIIKRFRNIFNYRWKLSNDDIYACFDNKLPLIEFDKNNK